MLHGRAIAPRCARRGMAFDVKVRDVEAHDRAQRRADQAWAQARDESALPSGNTAYRRLPDFEAALKALAVEYPGLVKPITLSHRSSKAATSSASRSRATRVAQDGKPIFLNIGAHHAREWPSAEHPWSSPTTCCATTATTRVRRGSSTRRGRSSSRSSTRTASTSPARRRRPERHFRTSTTSTKRKNCRVAPLADGVPGALRRQPGRPRSRHRPQPQLRGLLGRRRREPRTGRRHVPRRRPVLRAGERRTSATLMSTRQITNLITNHTFSQPRPAPAGRGDVGAAARRAAVQALGARMASHNGYANIPGYGLYDTTGTTEDWIVLERPAGSASRSRSATRRSTRRSSTRSSASTSGRASRGRGQGRQPRGVLPRCSSATVDAANALDASAVRRRSGSRAVDRQGVQTETSPVLHTTAGRLGPTQYVPGQAGGLDDVPEARRVRVGGQPVDPAVRGRSVRSRPLGRRRGWPSRGQPGRRAGGEHRGHPLLGGPDEEVPVHGGGPPEVDNGQHGRSTWAGRTRRRTGTCYVNDADRQRGRPVGANGRDDRGRRMIDPPAGQLHAR